MKKLLLLVVLALGLCASPAFAATIDFTQLGQLFVEALNADMPPYGDWYFEYQFPNSEAGIRLKHHAGDNTGWYKSADGLSIDIHNGFAYVECFVYSDLANRTLGLPPDGFSITYSTTGLSPYITFLRETGFMTGFSPRDRSDYEINKDGFVTSDIGYLFANPINFDSTNCLFRSFILAPYNTNTPVTFTISSISYPDHYGPPAVPVPAAVWLLGTGVAGVAALRRKFK